MHTPSKINLFLKVTARRNDGFHDLDSLFLPLSSPADKIEVDWNAEPGIRVRSNVPDLPEDLNNLVGKAAQKYAEKNGIRPGWTFFVEKHIPVTAGMGGGSSDAAAALRLLNGKYHALPPKELAELAEELGSDVPFFLNPCPALVAGRGERISPLDFPVKIPPILLVNPHFPISAKWAYTHLEKASVGAADATRKQALLEALHTGDTKKLAENLFNDLEAAALEKFPLLSLLQDQMLQAGALGVLMSGSGPTLFAVCDSPQSRRRLAAKLRSAFSPGMLTILEAAYEG